MNFLRAMLRFTFVAVRRWAVPIVGVAAIVAAVVFWPSGERQTGGAGGWWTCSMHPQIRLDHFDVCPLCGMDLTPIQPATAAEHNHGPDHLHLSPQDERMAHLVTAAVERRSLFREIRTVGKIDFDETRMAQITSRVDGRVEQVFADFPGTNVKPGDHLVSLYSPDLVATQEEMLAAWQRSPDRGLRPAGESSLVASSRRRLKLWGITDEQLDAILQRGEPDVAIVIHAPLGGTVVEKLVRNGQVIRAGELLYTIADLSHVWLIVEVYENDLAWVRFGQSVQVSLEADPAAAVTGLVGFVEPVLNEQTRTVRVRVILQNELRKLKPGMFAQALIRVAVMPDGTPAPTGLEGKFACPMHPYVLSDVGGSCRVCQMPLEKIPGTPIVLHEPPTVLAVPADAVLTTGRRQFVYVRRGEGVFQFVQPHFGPRAGDFYPVLHGLEAGDQVVSRGNFLLDSQFQISGKPSLLYPEGAAPAGGHQHGATAASGGVAKTATAKSDEAATKIARNLARLPPADKAAAEKQAVCPVTGEPLGSMGVPVKLRVEGRDVFLCCAGCTPIVNQNPKAALEKLTQPKK